MTGLILLVVGLGVICTVLSSLTLFWVTRRRRISTDHLPPVTILKPLKGVDEDLETNLRSFFALDYPVFQLIFGVAEADDPAIAVVRKLMAEFPEQDAELVIGNPAFGLNPKVENLAAMDRFRKHEVILISDSNVRVRPGYLRESACYLADPRVGLVTNLFAGVDEQKYGAALENLQLNGFIAGGFASASMLGITCVVGKSMLMPVRVLHEIGGFGSVRNLLAEDQAIGLKVRKAGYQIRLSHHVIDNVNRERDLRWFLNRHSRWYKIRRQMALPAFLIEPATNLGALGIVWFLADPDGYGWMGFGLLAGLAMLRDAAQTWRLRGSLPRWRDLPLSIVKDLFLLPIWFDALWSTRVNWRGHRLIVGRFTRLRRARVRRAVHRRVRRVKQLRYRSRQD
jgi:ceramide glucosyltransferase